MPQEFIARNGLIALNNTIITGSLNVTAGITGSLFGTASWAQNAVTSSYILSAVSASFATSASLAQTASYVLNAVSASFASTASSVNTLNQNVIISGSLTVFTGSAIEFQVTNTGTKLGNAITDTHTVTGSLNVSGSENVRGSGSAVFTVDGTSGRLFSVDDSLSGSLFSVNTAAGLPVVEAFSDNTVRIGQYGQKALFVSQSRVGIGKESALNGVLDVSGSTTMTGSLTVGAFTSSFAGNVGIGTTTPSATLDVNGYQVFSSGGIYATSAASTALTSELNYFVHKRLASSGAMGFKIFYGGDSSFWRYDGGTGDVEFGNIQPYPLKFYTNNTEKLRILSNGNVGINKTAPNSTLDVNGNTTITGSLNVNGTSATIKATGNSYGGTSFVNGTWGYAKVGILGEPTIAMISNVQGSAQSLEGITIPATSSALLFSSGYGYNVGNNYQIISVGTLGVRVGNTTQALTIPTSGIVTVNQGLIITGSLNITGSITTTGTITAQTLVVQTITSSVSFITGSTKFGSSLSNTHQFTGSVSITGSLTVTGAGITGSLFGTSSWAQNAALLNGTASSVFATTGSNTFNGNEIINGTVRQNIQGESAEQFLIYDNIDSNNMFQVDTDPRQIIMVPVAGNVGIGKTVPNATLDVNGNTIITGSLIVSGSSTLINIGPAIFTGSITQNASTASFGGLVGIGTTSPSYKLDVNGDARFGDGNNFNPLIQYAGSGRAAGSPGYSFVGDLDTGMYNPNLGNTIAFSTAGTERIRIISDGNVGIGTTSPSNLFEVNGISAVVNSYGAFTALQASGSTGYRWTLANDASFRLQYTTNGFAGLAGTPLYVSSSGNIGIGTTSPSLKLDVSGSDAVFNGVRVGRGAGNIATNTLVGSGSLASNTTGNNNTAVGYQALASGSTGNYNTAIGSNALFKATGGANTALGYSAGSEMTTGAGNTVIGTGNNLKPDQATLTTQTGILSLSSADQPEIWGQLVQVEVDPLDNATILSIDATVYAGAVVDYSLQDDAGNQRTSTMLIAFDCDANVSYTDPNQIEQGGTGDYTFIPIKNGTVDLVLTNYSGDWKCAVVLSCRLLKRYFGC